MTSFEISPIQVKYVENTCKDSPNNLVLGISLPPEFDNNLYKQWDDREQLSVIMIALLGL